MTSSWLARRTIRISFAIAMLVLSALAFVFFFRNASKTDPIHISVTNDGIWVGQERVATVVDGDLPVSERTQGVSYPLFKTLSSSPGNPRDRVLEIDLSSQTSYRLLARVLASADQAEMNAFRFTSASPACPGTMAVKSLSATCRIGFEDRGEFAVTVSNRPARVDELIDAVRERQRQGPSISRLFIEFPGSMPWREVSDALCAFQRAAGMQRLFDEALELTFINAW